MNKSQEKILREIQTIEVACRALRLSVQAKQIEFRKDGVWPEPLCTIHRTLYTICDDLEKWKKKAEAFD